MKTWEDQPDLIKNFPVLASGWVEEKSWEVRKHDDAQWGWFVTIGNLFGSQTFVCPSAEHVLLLLNECNKSEKNRSLNNCRGVYEFVLSKGTSA